MRRGHHGETLAALIARVFVGVHPYAAVGAVDGGERDGGMVTLDDAVFALERSVAEEDGVLVRAADDDAVRAETVEVCAAAEGAGGELALGVGEEVARVEDAAGELGAMVAAGFSAKHRELLRRGSGGGRGRVRGGLVGLVVVVVGLGVLEGDLGLFLRAGFEAIGHVRERAAAPMGGVRPSARWILGAEGEDDLALGLERVERRLQAHSLETRLEQRAHFLLAGDVRRANLLRVVRLPGGVAPAVEHDPGRVRGPRAVVRHAVALLVAGHLAVAGTDQPVRPPDGVLAHRGGEGRDARASPPRVGSARRSGVGSATRRDDTGGIIGRSLVLLRRTHFCDIEIARFATLERDGWTNTVVIRRESANRRARRTPRRRPRE